MKIDTCWDRLCGVVGTAALLALAVAAFTPIASPASRLMATPPDAGRADAAVVLGATMDPDGRLQDASLRRAIAGILLQRQGRVRLVLMLGALHGDGNEAHSRARLARDLGVPPSALLTETRGMTTALEAARSAAVLKPLGVRRILLVTGQHHQWRARRLFERVGFEVLAAPVPEDPATSTAPSDRLATLQLLVKELTARLLYRVTGRV